MSKMNTLILLSGGLDSTTCLLKLLSETDDNIHALYVDVDNNDDKAWCEKNAVKKILKETEKSFRTIEYTKCKISIPKSEARDISLQPLMWLSQAAFYMSSIDSKNRRVCLGYTQNDSIINRLESLRTAWGNIYKSLIDGGVSNVPKIYTPILKQSKEQSINYIKKIEKRYELSILKSLWICEDPKFTVNTDFCGYEACGECTPCGRATKLGLINK